MKQMRVAFLSMLLLGAAITAAAQKPDSSKTIEVDHKVFTKTEKPAEFPGGPEGWRKYLEANLRYPNKAQRKGIQGLVKVQFIVDKEGNVSEVQALNDPGGGLAEEAVRIIKNGPKWIPAEQNNKKVIYRHIQSLTFRLE